MLRKLEVLETDVVVGGAGFNACTKTAMSFGEMVGSGLVAFGGAVVAFFDPEPVSKVVAGVAAVGGAGATIKAGGEMAENAAACRKEIAKKK